MSLLNRKSILVLFVCLLCGCSKHVVTTNGTIDKKIGYVANSPYTVLGESYSAGRLYDKISEEASGKVKFILDKGVICELIE